jgi:hypothetical protein
MNKKGYHPPPDTHFLVLAKGEACLPDLHSILGSHVELVARLDAEEVVPHRRFEKRGKDLTDDVA